MGPRVLYSIASTASSCLNAPSLNDHSLAMSRYALLCTPSRNSPLADEGDSLPDEGNNSRYALQQSRKVQAHGMMIHVMFVGLSHPLTSDQS